MYGSLEKRRDGDRQRDRDRPGFTGPFGLLQSCKIKNMKNILAKVICIITQAMC